MHTSCFLTSEDDDDDDDRRMPANQNCNFKIQIDPAKRTRDSILFFFNLLINVLAVPKQDLILQPSW